MEVASVKTDKLLEQILSSENLNQAFLQVKRNKGAEGIDGMKVNELIQSKTTHKVGAEIKRKTETDNLKELGSQYFIQN